ncbi:hypothetical protein TTHERM_000693107 (macronuclear) [Tetrahymena thermophila SB210]|uniref:Uncharacterized protein n=1 Tax=Tetrahymena thermophila (strain SB210) TaxID=312017 RepID=W7X411_TETTS|nr:hypothetical protein TTHERM_000693107 [Tetrahymena thermophila SB210]EWS72172.1 hypothetical protein TTHERM_000693107 [Tetrahymena thermophila SB210]|eukprot:XP_012655303.1 hypothetical protein TTHERM_000693107 [Tetrahymena thermophila SB210]
MKKVVCLYAKITKFLNNLINPANQQLLVPFSTYNQIKSHKVEIQQMSFYMKTDISQQSTTISSATLNFKQFLSGLKKLLSKNSQQELNLEDSIPILVLFQL